MTRVSINGKYLDKIQMRLKGGHERSISYLSYPEHRTKVKIGNGEMVLQVPPLLALALYHNIFNKEKGIFIKVKNKFLGRFKIKNLHYNDELYGDGLVDIFMEQDGEKK